MICRSVWAPHTEVRMLGRPLTPMRAAHVVFGYVVDVLVFLSRWPRRVHDVVARRERRNVQPVGVQIDHIELAGVVVWHRRGVD